MANKTALLICGLLVVLWARGSGAAKKDCVTQGQLEKKLKKLRRTLEGDLPAFSENGKKKGGKCKAGFNGLEKLDDGYYLAFRASAGNGESVYAAYTKPTHDDDCVGRSMLRCDCLDLKQHDTCGQHYKSRIISMWSLMKVQVARVTVYTKGKEKVFFEFNATGSTSMNFFRPERLINSSYTDADTDPDTYKFFSIEGDSRSTKAQRRFFINRSYAQRCKGDDGWLMVLDASDACPYGEHNSYPVFLFSKPRKSRLWATGKIKTGDTLVVAVKFKNKFKPNKLVLNGKCIE